MNDRQWTGVVLAGGKSSRMGRDKALIEVDGITLLDRAIDRLRPYTREVIVIADPLKYAPAHARVLPDDRPGLGPLGGIATTLRHARYVRLLVLACDLPNINDRLLIQLKNGLVGSVDAVVPRHPDGIEPLAAAYHRHTIECFQGRIADGNLKMTEALTAINTAWLAVQPGEYGWPADLFRNLNALSDL